MTSVCYTVEIFGSLNNFSMNIKITYNWLKEYLDTDADPYELQKYLSLCGPSVETVEKAGDDYVMDIEVTSNRVDSASVFGIAREAQAILPRFGKKAVLKKNPLDGLRFPDAGVDKLPLTITIQDKDIASRVTAVVLSDVTIRPSPESIRERLEHCGIRSINNVVDVTNYLMLEIGQPSHVFDYDTIKDHVLTMRLSTRGEAVTTLDGKKIELPGGDIVIEDGSGTLIDLCGIMGGQNSAVSEHTKNIILFIQTYNKRLIRKTSMTTGQRSVAVAYFEKGLDEERVEPAVASGIGLLTQFTGCSIASRIIDIFPSPYRAKTVPVSHEKIERTMGITISSPDVIDILNRLGFEVSEKGGTYEVSVPPERKYDIAIPEDIVEEVARIYGYHALPNVLSPMVYIKQPHEIEEMFAVSRRIKTVLKHCGLTESVNYSMVSGALLDALKLERTHHLALANSISEELKYMRISLIPSLVKNIADNEGKRDVLKIFEIAKVYYPHGGDLPKEVYKAAVAVTSSFDDLKGIIDALLFELKIEEVVTRKSAVPFFSPTIQVDYRIGDRVIGSAGMLSTDIRSSLGIRKPVYLASFDLLSLIEYTRLIPQYRPVNPYAVIKLDLTAKITEYEQFKSSAFRASGLLRHIEYIGRYNENVTVRLFFSSLDRNLTEQEANKELEKIAKMHV